MGRVTDSKDNLADVFNLWFGPTGRAIIGVIYCVCKSPYALLLVCLSL